MPSLNEVVTEVRGRLGDPSEAELPMPQIARAIEGALREFSRFYPETLALTLDLVADQSEYALPDGVVGVSEAATVGGMDSMTDLPMPWDRLWTADALDYWRDVHVDYMRPKVIEPSFQVLDGEPPTLRMIPAPTRSGKLALVVEKIAEVETMSRTVVEGVIQWAEGDCLEYIGRKRSKSVTDIPTATGRLKLSDGSDLRREGREQKRQQECEWGAGSTVIDGG
jgi:hypothetical protein